MAAFVREHAPNVGEDRGKRLLGCSPMSDGWMHDDVDADNCGAEIGPTGTLPLPPGVVLMDPKYPRNVGAVMRSCSCYGIHDLVITGRRVPLKPHQGYRLPREERMRGYADVTLQQSDRPFDLFGNSPVTFVAVEVRENAERLPFFEHPPNPVYVFGPEDGSLGRQTLQHCHRFVVLPTKHCLNLATAVSTVLYDRTAKMLLAGQQLNGDE